MQLGPSFNSKEDRLQAPIKNKDMGFKKIKGEYLYVDRQKNLYIKQKTMFQPSPDAPVEQVIRYFNLVDYQDTIFNLKQFLQI